MILPRRKSRQITNATPSPLAPRQPSTKGHMTHTNHFRVLNLMCGRKTLHLQPHRRPSKPSPPNPPKWRTTRERSSICTCHRFKLIQYQSQALSLSAWPQILDPKDEHNPGRSRRLRYQAQAQNGNPSLQPPETSRSRTWAGKLRKFKFKN